jgi:hypothetical protein
VLQQVHLLVLARVLVPVPPRSPELFSENGPSLGPKCYSSSGAQRLSQLPQRRTEHFPQRRGRVLLPALDPSGFPQASTECCCPPVLTHLDPLVGPLLNPLTQFFSER